MNEIYKSDTGRRYSDLRVFPGVTYLAFMEKLGLAGFSNTFAHLDPDILHEELVDRESGWKGIFGFKCNVRPSLDGLFMLLKRRRMMLNSYDLLSVA